MSHELTPLISIIIAVFNGRNTLQQCIDSVVQQGYQNKELIIIDGGSTDGSVELLIENQENITYWVSELDKGVYSAWNKGLLQAKGEWICFIGADDYFWGNAVLERLVPHLQKLPTTIRIAYGQIMLLTDDGQEPRSIGEPWIKLKDFFKQFMCLPHVGTMHRRSLFEQRGNFNETFKIAGDYELLLRELKTADAAFISDITTIGQRFGGISTKAGNRFFSLREIWRAQRLNGQFWPGEFLRNELLTEFCRLLLYKIFGEELGVKLLHILLQSIDVIRQVFSRKIFTLFNVLWTLKVPENRSRLILLIRDYMDGIEHNKVLSAHPKSPAYAELCPQVDLKDLLVIHEFSRTGAPYAALYLARALFNLHGVRPVIISAKEGPLREQFMQEGFATIVDPLLYSYQDYSLDVHGFLAKFERVIVISLASFDFIRCFRGITKNLIWWIHETTASFEVFRNKADLPLLFAVCQSIWLGSSLCKPHALQYAAQDKLHLLVYGCPDTALPSKPNHSGKIIFTICGTIEQRKGQDIFVDAVERLPLELRRGAIFRVIGSPLPNGDSFNFYKQLHAKAIKIPEIEFYETMSFDQLQEFYAETDVFVSASTDDPMPIVITQGLMFSKTCLCSSAIGQAQLLQDGINGLIYESASVDALVTKMVWVLHNTNQLATVGKAGRTKYEEHFLMQSFTRNVESLL